MVLRPRYLAVGAVGLAYLLAAQWLMTRTPPPPWSALALYTPMLMLLAVGAWRSGRRVWSVAAAAVLGGLALQAAWGGGFAAERLYLLEHCAIHLGLALGFGSTLRRGRRPLITTLAERVHPNGLTPDMSRYTRKVTVAWTVYFAAMAALSIGLYLGTPFAVWAAFANLATPLALVLMFAAEFTLRYRLHPEFERATINDAIRAYTQNRRAAPPSCESRP